MLAILFLCTANQFRSPIAEACFSQKLAAANLAESWKVASAGTWARTGVPAHPLAVTAAQKIGLDLSSHKTQGVDADFLQAFDLIVVMENHQKEALELEFPATHGHIVLLGVLANLPDGEIPDPARDGFSDPDGIASLVCMSVQRTFSKLIRLTSLLHDGFSIVNPDLE